MWRQTIHDRRTAFRENIDDRNNFLWLLAAPFSYYGLMFSVEVLYLINNRAMSNTQALTLVAAGFVSSVVFEIPSGDLSDKISRKKMYVAGQVLFASVLVGYLTNHFFLDSSSAIQFAYLAVFKVLSGLGLAMQSGSDIALIKQSIRDCAVSEETAEKKFADVYSKKRSLNYLGLGISGLLGAFLYSIHPILPFIAASATMVIPTSVSLLLKDTKEYITPSQKNRSRHTRETLRQLAKPEIKKFTLIGTQTYVFGNAAYFCCNLT